MENSRYVDKFCAWQTLSVIKFCRTIVAAVSVCVRGVLQWRLSMVDKTGSIMSIILLELLVVFLRILKVYNIIIAYRVQSSYILGFPLFVIIS